MELGNFELWYGTVGFSSSGMELYKSHFLFALGMFVDRRSIVDYFIMLPKALLENSGNILRRLVWSCTIEKYEKMTRIKRNFLRGKLT